MWSTCLTILRSPVLNYLTTCYLGITCTLVLPHINSPMPRIYLSLLGATNWGSASAVVQFSYDPYGIR